MSTLVRIPRRVPGALVATALALFPSGLAAQSIPVSIGGPLSSYIGVPFQTPVQVDLSGRSEKLGSFVIRLQWNPAVLRIDSGVSADFGKIYLRPDSIPLGVLRFTGANPAGMGGKMTVGVGYAVPLIGDTTTIRVQVLELYAAGSFADLSSSAVATNRQYCPARGRYGDLESDGVITARDAQIALMAAVGLALPAGTDRTVGDVDGDGLVDTRDALIILSKVVGLNTGAFRLLEPAPGGCATDQVTTIVLDPGDQTVVIGQHLLYAVKATDPAQNLASATGVTWASTNTAVATVNSGGDVTAVAAGQAVITATEAGGRQASAAVTVVAARKKHFVSALAINARNQLGSAGLPFSTIQDGVAFAQAGDTVLVGSGRYEGGIWVSRSVTIRGAADTGLARPFISGRSGTPADSNGVVITAGVRVELRGLRFDTLYQALHIKTADTVILSDDAFRARSVGYATIYVDSVSTLRIRRSRFDGTVTQTYAVSALYLGGWAKVLDVDSTLITDYGDDAMSVYGVDSLIVRNSVLRFNRGYGIYASNANTADSARVMRAVFSRNVMTQNLYGDVYLTKFRTVNSDHNVLVGGGYNGFQLHGDSTSVISFLGDTLAIEAGYWLSTSRFDSLSVDSVTVKSGYYADVSGGRVTVVRNSAFQSSSYYGMQLDPYPLPTGKLVLRNVAFQGDRSCDRCADGIYAYNTSIDADGITGDNLNYGIYKSYEPLSLTNSTFTHVDYAVSSDCGTVRVDNLTMTGGGAGIDASGCPADSLVVDHSTISSDYYSISSNSIALVVRNSVFNHGEYGISATGGTALVEDNTFNATGSYSDRGIYIGGLDAGALVVRRNTLACDHQYEYGIQVQNGPITINDNAIGAGCRYGIYVGNGSSALGTPIEVRSNTITMGGNGYYGIGNFGSKENVRIVKNTVTGPAYYGSIYVGYTDHPRAIVDSNTVTNVYNRGIRGGYSDTLRIMDNTITNLVRADAGYAGAIVLEGGGATNAIAQVLRNQITFSKSNGIVIARGGSDTVTVLVDSNAVRGADTVGVWVRYYSRALLRKNAIDSSGFDGIRVSENYIGAYCSTPTNSTVAVQNSLTRNKGFGLNNIIYCAPYTVVADNNWWGNANGPRCVSGCDVAGADSVSTNVTFTPFLVSAPTDVPSPAPSIVASAVAAPVVWPEARAAPSARNTAPDPAARARAEPVREAPRRLPRSVSLPGSVAERDGLRQALELRIAAARAERQAQIAARLETRQARLDREAAERAGRRSAAERGTP